MSGRGYGGRSPGGRGGRGGGRSPGGRGGFGGGRGGGRYVKRVMDLMDVSSKRWWRRAVNVVLGVLLIKVFPSTPNNTILGLSKGLLFL